MQGNRNGIMLIPNSDKKTKLKITQSSQMLKKKLTNINNEHSKALSKINRSMEEAKHSMRSLRSQNESSQSIPAQKRVSRSVQRRSNRASFGLHGTSCSSGVRKEMPTPGFEQSQLVDKGRVDGLAQDKTEQNSDVKSLGNACQSLESSVGDATGNQIETKEEKPNPLKLGTARSKNNKLLGRRASTSTILFPGASRAELALKTTEVNTISARMNRVRKLSDETCGATYSSASGMQPKIMARRSSVSVMTTSTTSLFDFIQLQSKIPPIRCPSEPSLSTSQISPRYNLSLEGTSGNARERKHEATVHESLLKIGRRIVAPMTGAELEGKLQRRRHSVQYPLVSPLAIARAKPTSTSESDLYSALENCRYLRKPSKWDEA